MAILRNLCTLAVFAFAFLLILSFPRSSRAQRYCCEGDTWIKWTEDHREDYVRGYILGRAEGYSDACYKEAKYLPLPIVPGDEKNPIGRCLKEMPDFSRGPEHFAKQVTELYTLHPQDRILLITEVLEALGSGKSVQDIYEHPPFPTPKASPKGDSPHSP